MQLSEITNPRYGRLARDVLAVLTVGPDGYRIYVGAVPGQNHDDEWMAVKRHGVKQPERVAKCLAEGLFGATVDVPYAA